jgi:uncharacterized protein YjbI with pentapeptide repeats
MQRSKNILKTSQPYDRNEKGTWSEQHKSNDYVDMGGDDDSEIDENFFQYNRITQDEPVNVETPYEILDADQDGAFNPFYRMDMISLNLSGDDFLQANLSNIKIISCTFRGANLQQADLNLSEVVMSDFHNANLRDASLSEANILHSDFSHACLIRANLQGSLFMSCSLAYANLCGANLKDCILTSVDMFGSSYDESTKLPFDDMEAANRGMKKSTARIYNAS